MHRTRSLPPLGFPDRWPLGSGAEGLGGVATPRGSPGGHGSALACSGVSGAQQGSAWREPCDIPVTASTTSLGGPAKGGDAQADQLSCRPGLSSVRAEVLAPEDPRCWVHHRPGSGPGSGRATAWSRRAGWSPPAASLTGWGAGKSPDPGRPDQSPQGPLRDPGKPSNLFPQSLSPLICPGEHGQRPSSRAVSRQGCAGGPGSILILQVTVGAGHSGRGLRTCRRRGLMFRRWGLRFSGGGASERAGAEPQNVRGAGPQNIQEAGPAPHCACHWGLTSKPWHLGRASAHGPKESNGAQASATGPVTAAGAGPSPSPAPAFWNLQPAPQQREPLGAEMTGQEGTLSVPPAVGAQDSFPAPLSSRKNPSSQRRCAHRSRGRPVWLTWP